MTRLIPLWAIITLCVAATASAQETPVEIPSRLELSDVQKKELQALVRKELEGVVKTCVGSYPRPALFTTVAVTFELRKTGVLRGTYIPGLVDANVYVASDEERAQREADGSLARKIVSGDRDIERCFQRGTREIDASLDRYAAVIDARFDIQWKGSAPKLTAADFQITSKN